MGRKRLLERDAEILNRYCQGFTLTEICAKFKMTLSQLAKIIRRATAEGYQFKTAQPEPWGRQSSPQKDLF